MIGAGTIINPIIKIVTTVIILGAVYLFFVKPALDTTENISENFDTSGIQQSIQESFDNVPNFDSSEVVIPNSAEKAQKLGDCVQNAGTDIDRINRCMERFGS
jgi:hypothetical protein